MPEIFADTAGLLAAFVATETHHAAAAQLLRQWSGDGTRLVTSNYIFCHVQLHFDGTRRALRQPHPFAASAANCHDCATERIGLGGNRSHHAGIRYGGVEPVRFPSRQRLESGRLQHFRPDAAARHHVGPDFESPFHAGRFSNFAFMRARPFTPAASGW